MHKLLIPFLILFFPAISFAQKNNSGQMPDIDISFREKLFKQKALHYQEMLQNDLQKTTNQNSYDITYYSLHLAPDTLTSVLDATVEIAGKITSASLQTIELNFWDGMVISALYTSADPATALQYQRNNDMLTVYLEKNYNRDEQFRITIIYSGRPQDSIYRSFNFDYHIDSPMIWTMSSVFRARGWWPCKDVPSDKADSMDIRITVPNNLIAVSNGKLRQVIDQGDKKTYYWHEKYPIATYLVSISAYAYEMHYAEYKHANGSKVMPIAFYSFPGVYENYSVINNLVDDMLTVYAGLFGEYPFVEEKYAQVDFLWSGGMEHQTATSYGSWREMLYAHEIAHQWWGDMITCDNFQHIWLNEGFASYSEALWFENAYPSFSASDYQVNYQMYLGPGTIIVEDPYSENIFDHGLSYDKASWVLHMLRHVVGDDIFFNILKTYCDSQKHKYGSATTEEFQEICEKLSGMKLEKFFRQWIYQEYYPIYSYQWYWSKSAAYYNINLVISQEQNNHVFWMPIDIPVTMAESEITLKVWDSLKTQTFNLSVPSRPLSLQLDKNDWVLKRISMESMALDSVGVSLNQNFPNPFSEETCIQYELPVSGRVKIIVYNVLGQEVAMLRHAYQLDKYGEVLWDSDKNNSTPAAGLYFLSLVLEGDNNRTYRKRIKMLRIH